MYSAVLKEMKSEKKLKHNNNNNKNIYQFLYVATSLLHRHIQNEMFIVRYTLCMYSQKVHNFF